MTDLSAFVPDDGWLSTNDLNILDRDVLTPLRTRIAELEQEADDWRLAFRIARGRHPERDHTDLPPTAQLQDELDRLRIAFEHLATNLTGLDQLDGDPLAIEIRTLLTGHQEAHQ